jgi:hypothetical protein
MKTKITLAIAAGLFLLAAPPVFAAPMRCSGEQKTCSANCLKIARTVVASCLEACHVTQQACMRTGCWANGTSKYCGLMKQ